MTVDGADGFGSDDDSRLNDGGRRGSRPRFDDRQRRSESPRRTGGDGGRYRGQDRDRSDDRGYRRDRDDRPRDDRGFGDRRRDERDQGDRRREGRRYDDRRDDRGDSRYRRDDDRGGAGRGERRYGSDDRRGSGRGDQRRDDRRGSGRGRDDRGYRRYGGDRRGRGPDRARRDDRGRQTRAPHGADHRGARVDGPELPEDVTPDQLDISVRRDLHTLDKANADAVARHLVMAGRLVDVDPELALEHARTARERAGRIAVVREAVGISAYHAGQWAEALSELRAARRMGGGPGLLAVMADCERGLGRPEKALELGRSEEARQLDEDQARELRIVLAGARLDLGQADAAVVTLQTPDLKVERPGPEHARLFYVYAEALLAADRRRDALTWFFNAASADTDGVTDAEDRLAELAGEDQ